MTRDPIPVLFSLLALLLLLLPPVVLLWQGIGAWSSVNNAVLHDAVMVSLKSTLTSVVGTLVLGTPVAYLLAYRRASWVRILDVALDIPVVLPPVVAGFGLLLVFGRQGVLGGVLPVSFSFWAVVLAQMFVAAPLYIKACKAGFLSVDNELILSAKLDGASDAKVLWHIILPLAWVFMLEGIALCWARALGEFGATLLFAGSLQGVTQTLPLAIYNALESDLNTALAMSAMMTVLAFTVLGLFRWLARTKLV